MEILTPSVVLASYAEPVLDGRRAVVFGDSSSPLAVEMVARGARSVHLCDSDPARAAEFAARNRSRQISIVSLDEADVAVREGAFDVAIIEDLSTSADSTALLKLVRRALAPRGVAFVASPNPDSKRPLIPRTTGASASAALGYYELYDKVAVEFTDVRMLGQTPFVGYAVVDFAPLGELEVELDSDFLPTGAEEPEWFVAVGAREPVELAAFSVVQLPASRVVGAGTDDKLAEELRAARSRETALASRVTGLEADNAKLTSERRSRKTESNSRTEELLADVEAKNKRIVELEATKAALEATKAAFEATKTALEAQAKNGARDLESLRERAAKADQTNKDREAAVADRDRLKAALEQAIADRDRLKAALEQAQAEAGAAKKEDDKEADVTKLESVLAERGERIRKLEADLREAERLGRELVKELAREVGLRGAAPEAGDQAKVAQAGALAAENARLRADLQAAEWSIQELENRLDHALRRPADTDMPKPVTEAKAAGPDADRTEPGTSR